MVELYFYIKDGIIYAFLKHELPHFRYDGRYHHPSVLHPLSSNMPM